MKQVFDASELTFPYIDLKFPGQATDEKILYAHREAPIMLTLRLIFVAFAALVLTAVSLVIIGFVEGLVGNQLSILQLAALFLGGGFGVIGMWWIYMLWKKSIFLITNRRLTKFIYVTPWNRYNLSVTYDGIEDTGAYTKGYFQALLKLGTFTARSAAGNREEKYFYVNYVEFAEDLANYVNKALFIFRENPHKLDTFRPFIPKSEGRREELMQEYPEYWS